MSTFMPDSYDIAVIGGGPAGSTVGSVLKKYAPSLRVGIFERELFPREHVGESLLPPINGVLAEIGVWDAVEAAGFPIKIGATYKWGSTDDLWDFNLLDTREIVDNIPRPGKFEGWRQRSTWQVERAAFDEILLDHSNAAGCEVFEGCGIAKIEAKEGRVTGLKLTDGREVTARYYVDASGSSGILRRAMGVELEEPASLRNIAIWDYWENAEWAVSIGVGGTRVQVTSLGYGWLWFIPVAPTRTSIGLVCPAEYSKRSGKRPEELYAEAVRADPRIASLLVNAKAEGAVRTTKDWSYLARQMTGENWFLVGEAAGFADPILAAGLTAAMVGAKECAYTILELDRGQHDRGWLRSGYEKNQRTRVGQHIRFANYWYSSNAHFTDLMEYTSEIAREAGYELDAQSAWQWLGTGGFISPIAGPGLAGHSVEQIKNLQRMMLGEESDWLLTRNNVFVLNLHGAEVDRYPVYSNGTITVGKVLRRDGRELPNTIDIRNALSILQRETALIPIIESVRQMAKQSPIRALGVLEAMESMLTEGWLVGSFDPQKPLLRPEDIPRTTAVDWNHDVADPMVKIAEPGVAANSCR